MADPTLQRRLLAALKAGAFKHWDIQHHRKMRLPEGKVYATNVISWALDDLRRDGKVFCTVGPDKRARHWFLVPAKSD